MRRAAAWLPDELPVRIWHLRVRAISVVGSRIAIGLHAGHASAGHESTTGACDGVGDVDLDAQATRRETPAARHASARATRCRRVVEHSKRARLASPRHD